MPDPKTNVNPVPPARTPQNSVDPNELLKNTPVNTSPVSPTVESPQAKTYIGQDGRTYYKYDVDGEVLVTTKPLEQMTEQDFYDLPVSAYEGQAGRIPEQPDCGFQGTAVGGISGQSSAQGRHENQRTPLAGVCAGQKGRS